MQKTLLTTLVDQKQLIGYLKSIPTEEQQRATIALTHCVYLGILLTILPGLSPAEQADRARLLATGSSESISAWKKNLEPDVQVAIQETIERIFLTLDTSV